MAWCMSISIMLSSQRLHETSCSKDRITSSLENYHSWSCESFFFFVIGIWPLCIFFFDCFSFTKRSYFCLKNKCQTRTRWEFFRQIIDVAMVSYLSETSVLCTLQGYVNAGLAPFPAFTTQSWLTAGSVGGSLKFELSGMPVMWSLHGGPMGDRTGCSWGLIYWWSSGGPFMSLSLWAMELCLLDATRALCRSSWGKQS